MNTPSDSNHKKHAIFAAIVGLLLVAPSLFTGLQLDDYYHWGVVTQNALAVPGKDLAGVFGLFTFLDGDPQRTQLLIEKGMLPWWTLPELKYAFWRPLSELTHGIDYLLWPKQPLLMHFHSMVYLLLLFVAVYKLLQRWLSGPSLKWAFWFFALSYTHGFAAGWLANRNAVLASIFVALTLYCHDIWRKDQNHKYHFVALVCFALGLFSGEIGVSAGLFLFSYALFLEKKKADSGVKGFIQNMFTIAPYGVLGIVWLFARGALGYGAEGSGHYVDPTNIASFLEIAGWRYFQLITGLFWSLPPEFGALFGDAIVIGVGLVGLILLVLVLWPLMKASPLARFFTCSLLIMLLPVCATNPHSRLLISASIPMAGLLGLYFGLRKQKNESIQFGPLAPVLSVLLIISLLVLSPLFVAVESVAMKLAMDGSLNKGAKQLVIEDDQREKIHVVLNPPLSSVAGYIQGVRAYHELSVAKAVIPLSSAMKPVELEVRPNNILRLSAAEGLYRAVQESLLRAPSLSLAVGDKVLFAGIQATVNTLNDEGVPTEVDFALQESLDHYVFHLWHKGAPVICQLPPAGSSLTLTQDRESCAL